MDSLELTVRSDDVDLATDLLWMHGVAGIEERTIDADTVRLVAGAEFDVVVALLAALDGRWNLTHREVDESEYRDAWRPWARAVRVAERLVIQPPWIESIAGAGDLVIELDPGAAWGHGAHPSTYLALELLAAQSPSVRSVLDVGCGSGVLAIAAAILGADDVRCIDIDPGAVTATRDNATRNGQTDHIEADMTPLHEITGHYQLILANIGCATLCEMAPTLASRAPDGVLVLSGLLDEQVDTVAAAYRAVGKAVRSRRSSEGWTALLLS